MPKRRIPAAVTLVVTLAALVIPAVQGAAATETDRQEISNAQSLFDRALTAHTGLEPKRRGLRIAGGENVTFRDGRPTYTRASDEEARPAAPNPFVTQDGVCNGPKYQLGDTRLLWVHNFKTGMDEQKLFRLDVITPHTYMWVDVTDVTTTHAELIEGAKDFEKIYDIDREYFGEPARCDRLPFRTPSRLREIWGGDWYDADDNLHINIANFPIDVGATVVAGYYSSADEFPRSANEHSNEGEWFYMNSTLFDPGTETYAGILAHEFYHMIQFPNDADEETWVNEGMADVAIEVNGFPSLTASHTSDYAVNPEDQLTHWDGALYDYGNAYSFLSYFLEHYGPQDDEATEFKENYALAEDITKFEKDGLDGLQSVLRSNPYRSSLHPYYQKRDIDDVFLDRAVANILNDPEIRVGQFGYGTLSSMVVQPHGEFNDYPQEDSGEAAVYGNHYYIFNSAADGDFHIESQPKVPIVPNGEGMPSPTHFLWGNRVDETETWAVREADLTGASEPHLRFGYWYNIEVDFDYAYVQISTDGGETWTNLACCESNNNDPNGNNQGNGITGESDGSYPDNPLVGPSWQQADIDLSEYAGQEALIRFFYDTDPAVNEPGFTVDNVEIVDDGTSIWPTATFESGLDGFEVDGAGPATFLVVEPGTPNNLHLQLVKVGTNRVGVKRIPASLIGDLRVSEGEMDAQRTIAIFTSLTRITSEPFGYSWTADASPIPELIAPELQDPGETVAPREPFTLEWSEANDAGTQPPIGYSGQVASLLVNHVEDHAQDLSNWTTSTDGEGALPWQVSSDKPNWENNPTFRARGAEGVIDASSYLIYNNPITLPTAGRTKLSFFDWHVNESDDAVAVEVSTDEGETWVPVYQTGRSALAPDAAVLFAEEPLNPHEIDLAPYKGETILLRFRYTLGSANRAGSTPFGWYVDDVVLQTENWSGLGMVEDTEMRLRWRHPGTYYFRVQAVYGRFLRGPYSNVVDITIAG